MKNKTTYYTVSSTRCMGVWNTETLDSDDGKNHAVGFKTFDAAVQFINDIVAKMKLRQSYRNVILERKSATEFKVTYETYNSFNFTWSRPLSISYAITECAFALFGYEDILRGIHLH